MSTPARDMVNWRGMLRDEANSWAFVLRTVVAMILSLAIAFRLDLSSPGSAAVTVSLIAFPQTGMVLEKSFYRLLGTTFGATVTLVLVAVFAQHRDTFIVAVATWIALCTAASAWYRGFQAYGWLLCGYTTCLIGIPAFLDASHAFDIAVDRVTIVSVGILSAGVASAVILPSRTSKTVVSLVRSSFRDFVAFVDGATVVGGADVIYRSQRGFTRDLATLDAARSSSVFEDPQSRIRNDRLFDFIGSFMSASSRLHLFHRQIDSLQRHGNTALLAAIEPLTREFREVLRVAGRVPATALEAEPLAGQFEALTARWPELECAAAAQWSGGVVVSGAVAADARAALVSTLFMLREAVREAATLSGVYLDMHALRHRSLGLAKVRSPFASDPLQAAVSGVRAGLVVVLCAAFWIASAWPAGFSLTFLAAVGCALFAGAPHPTAAARQMTTGFLFALPAQVICYSWVLPAATDFGMLTLGLLPFLVFGAWLMSRPGHALAGAGYFLMFLTGLNLTSVMSYDFVVMFNNVLGLMLGIVTAAVSLAVISPGDRDWRYHRAIRLLLGCVSMARTHGLRHLRMRFENRVRDLTVLLIALRPGDANSWKLDDSLGLMVVETGDAIIRLRQLAKHALPWDAEISDCLDALVKAVRRRDVVAALAVDEQLKSLYAAVAARLDAGAAGPAAGAPEDPVTEVLVALRTLRVALADFATLAPPALVEVAHAA